MKTAFVTFVYNGDKFVPGALALAHSLRRHCSSDHYLVVMVTEDVSVQAISDLRAAFDRVVAVPYIEKECIEFATHRRQEVYGSWISKSFTKWNALNLIEYDKIVLMDADMVVIHSDFEKLFALDCPAASFTTPWHIDLDGLKSYNVDKTGTKIPNRSVKHHIQNGSWGPSTTICVLQPSTEMFNAFKRFLDSMPKAGVEKALGTFDEQTIGLFMDEFNPSGSWTHLDQSFVGDVRKKMYGRHIMPLTIHYQSQKPWDLPEEEAWMDMKAWWRVAHEAMTEEQLNRYCV